MLRLEKAGADLEGAPGRAIHQGPLVRAGFVLRRWRAPTTGCVAGQKMTQRTPERSQRAGPLSGRAPSVSACFGRHRGARTTTPPGRSGPCAWGAAPGKGIPKGAIRPGFGRSKPAWEKEETNSLILSYPWSNMMARRGWASPARHRRRGPDADPEDQGSPLLLPPHTDGQLAEWDDCSRSRIREECARVERTWCRVRNTYSFGWGTDGAYLLHPSALMAESEGATIMETELKVSIAAVQARKRVG